MSFPRNLAAERDMGQSGTRLGHVQQVGHGTSVGHLGPYPPVGGIGPCPAVCPTLSVSQTQNEKVCTTCNVGKPHSQFFASKVTADGLHDVCIPCAKAGWKARSAERDARNARLLSEKLA